MYYLSKKNAAWKEITFNTFLVRPFNRVWSRGALITHFDI